MPEDRVKHQITEEVVPEDRIEHQITEEKSEENQITGEVAENVGEKTEEDQTGSGQKSHAKVKRS